MPIKSLFNGSAIKAEAAKKRNEVDQELETTNFGPPKLIDRERYIPRIDFSDPANWARYGSAERYYRDSYARIYNSYPFDGSKTEKQSWRNSGSFVDEYIFENLYPRTTGYVIFSANGWGTLDSTVSMGDLDVSTPTAAGLEYIFVKGGPNAGPTGTKTGANVYDTTLKRVSNLRFGGVDGNSIEFYLKKDQLFPNADSSEIIFSLVDSSGQSFSILANNMTGSSGSISVYAQTTGSSYTQEFTSPTVDESFDDEWHHYSISIEQDTGAETSVLSIRFDGELKETGSQSTAFKESESPIFATLGAFAGSGSYATGSGKLSGSLDEFRFWKALRTEKELGRNWFTSVDGGSNNDDQNIDLGVYFKFNEGILSPSAAISLDAKILDYSGRLSHGTWTGYTLNARNTGSAMTGEVLDPIMYSNNPLVTASLAEMVSSGSIHDNENNASLYNSMPGWLTEEDYSDQTLWNLTQIIGSYFDTLHLQMEELSSLRHVKYTPSGSKPLPFADRLLSSNGLIVPEVFVEASTIESLISRDEERLFEDKIENLKNRVYENIYNNLVWILKSKGTEKSLRNLIRCYGVDDELIKINLYSSDAEYTFEDGNIKNLSKGKKYVDFNHPDRFDSIVYQKINPSASNSVDYVTSSDNYTHIPFTAEAEVIFPWKFAENSEFYTGSFLTSSLYGMTGPTGSEAGFDFHVSAIKTHKDSEDVYFRVTSSIGVDVTSSVFYDVYNSEKWNFAVRMYPEEDLSSDTDSNTAYIFDFFGTNYTAGEKENSFYLSASLGNSVGSEAMKRSKRLYVGAQRTNFTGSPVHKCDAKISSVKFWLSKLDTEAIDAHAKDATNFGSLNPMREVSYNTNLTEIESLILHWTFEDNSLSDNGGGVPSVSDAGFAVKDVTSGSSRQYGELDNNIQKHHSGRGDFFLPNAKAIDKAYVFSTKQQLPEILNSIDMINISSQADQELFTKDISPVNYFWSVEKSMYQTVSEEMINWFGSVVGFNNLIGEPVNRYRIEYKDLGKLRQLFFEKIGNTPDLEKYIKFYKWIDSSVGIFLRQLVPASANFPDGIRNVVESHVLERNKYWTKYPTLEMEQPDPIGGVAGIRELNYNWKTGHAESTEDENALWWKERAERTHPVITSGDSEIDADKEVLRRIIISDRSGSNYQERKFARIYKENADRLTNIEDIVEKPVAQIANDKITDSVHAFYDNDDGSPSTFDNIAASSSLKNIPGNYREDYEIVQAHGQTNNNGWFVDMEGIIPRTTFVAPFSGSNNGLVQDDFLVAQRERKAHVFVERFSAPGEKKTMSEGRLDPIGGEKSPYNSINFRNLTVRNDLNTDSKTPYSSSAALLHKTNKNVDFRVNSEGTGLEEVYDNMFVQHQIPQNNFGYSWINASYVTESFAGKAIGFTELDSSGSALLLFTSASYFRSLSGSQITFDTDLNLVSFGNEWQRSMHTPYQWASWEQIRVENHPLAKYFKKQNIISIQDPPQERESFDSNGKRRVYKDNLSDSFKNYYEPPVTYNKPMIIQVKDANGNVSGFKFSHLNNFSMFSSAELMDRLGLERDENQVYDNVLELYKKENSLLTFVSLSNKEIIYPKEINTGFGYVRTRGSWNDLENNTKRTDERTIVWKDSKAERKKETVLGAFGNALSGSASIWAIDDGKEAGSAKGELNYFEDNNIIDFFINTTLDSSNSPSASLQFNHKNYSTASLSASYYYGSGSFLTNPTYNTYEKYSEEVRKFGQNFTVLPEFRMSEHMNYYVNEKGGDFRAENLGFLTLKGADVSGSSMEENTKVNEEFYKIYSHSDFLKHFNVVVEDHKDEEDKIKMLSMSCRGIKKLLPYNGFYPMQRSVQMGSLLSQSYGPYLTGSEGFSKQSQLQAFVQPFFAPGIFYNTMKSGIACDWAIQTSSLDTSEKLTDRLSEGHVNVDSKYKLPFESLVSIKDSFPFSSNDDEGPQKEGKKVYLLYPSFYDRTAPPVENELSGSVPEASEAGVSSLFGGAISFWEDGQASDYRIAVAAPGEDNTGTAVEDAGTVYLFRTDMFLTGSTLDAVELRIPAHLELEDSLFGGDTSWNDRQVEVPKVQLSGSYLFARAQKIDSGSQKPVLLVYTGSGDAWGFEQAISGGTNLFNTDFAVDKDDMIVTDETDDLVYFYTSSAGGPWGPTGSLSLTNSNSVDISGSFAAANSTYGKHVSIFEKISGEWQETQIIDSLNARHYPKDVAFCRQTGELFVYFISKDIGIDNEDIVHIYKYDTSWDLAYSTTITDLEYTAVVFGRFMSINSEYFCLSSIEYPTSYAFFRRKDTTKQDWVRQSGKIENSSVASPVTFFEHNSKKYFAEGYLDDNRSTARIYDISKAFLVDTPSVEWNGKEKPLYELAMHNFLAEVPNFFLKDNKFSSFVSSKEVEFDTFQSGTYYFMDVSLEKSSNLEIIKTNDTYKSGRFFGPPTAYCSTASVTTADYDNDVVDPSFAPYTPPYYYGKSISRVYFLPSETRKYTLNEILAGLQVENINDEAFAKTKKRFIFNEDIPADSVYNSGPDVAYAANGIPWKSDYETALWNNAIVATGSTTVGSVTMLSSSEEYFSVPIRVINPVTTTASFVADVSQWNETDIPVRVYSPVSPASHQGEVLISSSAPNSNFLSSSFVSFCEDLNLIPDGYAPSGSAPDTSNRWVIAYNGEDSSYYLRYSFSLSADYITHQGSDYYSASFDWIFNDKARNLEDLWIKRKKATQWPAIYYSSSLLIKDSPAFTSMANVESSINLTGKIRERNVEHDLTGLRPEEKTTSDSDNSAVDRWAISTRFECPVLDFSQYALSDDEKDVGMWAGYGNVPAESEGVYFLIEDSIKGIGDGSKSVPKYYIFDKTGDTEQITVKSLLSACKFKKDSKKKIGEISSGKVIKEAVVAIPFVDGPRFRNPQTVEIDSRHFFSINKDLIERQASEGRDSSITRMISKMKEYVIPPRYDFVTYENIKPFVMYLFEFEHELDQEDLSLIWQNLMPKVARRAEKVESRITHVLDEEEFFEGYNIPEHTRWMVFKVKQKAEIDYFKATTDSKDDKRFIFNFDVGKKAPEYSYNWPYDYFSLIEMGQIENDLYIVPEPEVQKEDKQLKDVLTPEKLEPIFGTKKEEKKIKVLESEKEEKIADKIRRATIRSKSLSKEEQDEQTSKENNKNRTHDNIYFGSDKLKKTNKKKK